MQLHSCQLQGYYQLIHLGRFPTKGSYRTSRFMNELFLSTPLPRVSRLLLFVVVPSNVLAEAVFTSTCHFISKLFGPYLDPLNTTTIQATKFNSHAVRETLRYVADP
jgi:hypothetical protein